MVNTEYDISYKSLCQSKYNKRKNARKIEKSKGLRKIGKEEKQKLEKVIRDVDSQSGMITDGLISSIRTILDQWELPDNITAIVLKSIMYYKAIQAADSWESYAYATGQYLLGLCPDDKFDVIGEVIFGDSTVDIANLALTVQPQSQAGFLESLEGLRNLRLLRDNELSRRIIAVITTAMACGLVRGKRDLYLTNFNLSFVLEQFTRDRSTIFDFFEAIVNILTFLVEKGHTCFQQRSFAPLFMSDEKCAAYEKDLAELLGNWEAVKAGNYKDTPFVSVPHFANALDTLFMATTSLVEQSTDDFSRRFHAKTLEKLTQIQAQFKSQERSGGLREAPFAFCVYGKSSIGKSSIMSTVTDYCLKATAYIKNPDNKKFKVDPRMICSQNANDKFDSDYKSYSLAVLFDDLANEKCEVSRQSPLDAVIRYVNNIKSTALKADVHEKGVIQKEPWLVGASTNIKNLQADQYSIEPISVLRRFNVHIEPHVAPDYQKEDGIFLDGGKLAREDAIIPNAWRFNVYHYEYNDVVQKQTNSQETLGYMNVPFRFKLPDGSEKCSEGLDMEELQILLYQQLKSHFKAQSSVVESNTKIGQNELCEHRVHSAICSICNPGIKKPAVMCQPCTDPEIPEEERRRARLQAEDADRNAALMREEDIAMGRLDPRHVADADSHAGFFSNPYTGIRRWLYNYVRACFFQFIAGFLYGLVYRWIHADNMRYWRARMLYDDIMDPVRYYTSAVKFYAQNWCDNVTDAINEVDNLRFIPWELTDLVPDSWVETSRFAWIYMFKHDEEYYPQLAAFVTGLWCILVGVTKFVTGQNYTARYGFALLGYVYIALLLRKKFLMKRMMEERGIKRQIAARTMRKAVGTSIQVMLTVGGVYVSYKIFKSILVTVREFGRLSHGGAIDLGHEEENVWLQAKARPLPKRDEITDTMSPDQVENVVRKNTITCHYDNKTWSSGFFPRSQILLVPAHEVRGKEEIFLKLIKDPENELSSGNKSFEMTQGRIKYFEGKDIAAVYHAGYQTKQDVTHLFPKELPQDSFDTKWVGRNSRGDMLEGQCRRAGIVKTVNTDKTSFNDSNAVVYDKETAGGDCMKVHFTDVNCGSSIVGFHLAGKGHTGFLSSLTQEDLLQVYAEFHANPATRLTANMGDMPFSKYGIDFTPESKAAPQSTINYLKDAEIDYLGRCPKFVTRPKSQVVVSPISDSVASHCGVSRQHGKPANCRKGDDKIPKQEPFNKYLQGVGKANQEFPVEIGEIAIKDYLNDMLANPAFMRDLKRRKVLTEKQTIGGIDKTDGDEGLSKYVDSMKMSTAKGFPESGTKEDIIIHLDPDEYPGHADPKTFKEEYMEDWRQARQVYLRGLRYYPVFKAATKDEPTKLSKKKVRVFQCAPLTLQCIIRQYFLPIASCMSNHPVTSECAVGINSQGPQWNKLMKHLSRFGQERIVAGDFKAYDQHMSATMTMWAFSIMIELAKHADYSDDDIKIMESVVADVIHPVMCVNGDLVELLGSNPSGQNLTVYINSIVNSLYQRCVFYTLYPIGSLKSNRFSDYVALMTYGDDNEMGVSPEVPRYNHTEMQKIYNGQGIEYTMADKDAESVPFIHLRDADFLKRATEFREEYSDPTTGEKGMFLAKLSEDSIFKSLHCNMASKHTTREAIARQCLDGAMRELWFHGREHFDMRHEQLKAVVADHKWEHLVAPSFYKTFDEREVEWLDKYNLVKASSQSGLLPYKYDQKEEPSSDESAIIDAWVAKAEKAGIVIRAREYSLDGEVYGDIIAQYGQEVWCVEFKAKGGLNAAMEQAHRQRTILRSVMKQKSWLGVAIVRAVAYTHNEYRVDSTVSKPMKKLFKSLL